MITIAKKFNNMNDLIKAMETEAAKALSQTADYTKTIIDDFIQEWYSDYTPAFYERTYQFLDSVVRSEVIKQSGNRLTVSVYLDKSLLHHNTDEEGILQAADNGLHGSIYNHFENGERHVRLWADAENEIRDKEIIFNSFENYLKNNGIPYERGR